MPDDSEVRMGHLDSMEVFHWPEFILFCERAGIPLDLGLRRLTITLEIGTCLTVDQTYYPRGIIGGKS